MNTVNNVILPSQHQRGDMAYVSFLSKKYGAATITNVHFPNANERYDLEVKEYAGSFRLYNVDRKFLRAIADVVS